MAEKFRILVDKPIITEEGTVRHYIEGSGNSGATKPTTVGTEGIISGSRAVEPDTGKIYLYDEKTEATDPWVEEFSLKA